MMSSSGCHILLDVFTPSFVIAMLAYYDPVANSCLCVMVNQGSSLCRWAVNVIWEIITLFFNSDTEFIVVEWSGDFPVAEGRLKPISDTAAVKRGQVK